MTPEEIIRLDHYLFACEAMNGLHKLYGIPIELVTEFSKDYFFNNDILWGIATICYLFRRDFFKIFSKFKESLNSKRQFKKYCMLIPVSKNDRYFFNYLRRVALIYEMAVYCYKNGNDYFAQALNCISRYPDKDYFHSAGSWPRLTKTASFLRELGNPFLTIILEESRFRSPLRLTATIKRIEKRLKKDYSCILHSKEMRFLIQQKEKFATRTQDETKRDDAHTEREQAFSQCLKSISSTTSKDTPVEVSIEKEKQSIIEYLGSLLLSEFLNKLNREKISSDRTCHSVSDSIQPVNKHLQSHPNSDDQSKETEGSSVRNDEVPVDIKCLSLSERPSDKSGNEQTEAKFNEEDLISEGSSCSDENEQLDYINKGKVFLSSKSMIYSSMESITSGSLQFGPIDSSGNESNSLDLCQNEFLPGCSKAAENVQPNRNENKYLDMKQKHSSSSDSDTESSTSEFENTPSDVEYLMQLFEEGFDHRSQLLSTDVYNPENVSAKQSTVSDEKQDNENPKDDKKVQKITINLNSLTGRYDEASGSFRISVTPISSTEMNIPAVTSETNSNHLEMNTNEGNSISNSQPPQSGGKKRRRKKKKGRGKRK